MFALSDILQLRFAALKTTADFWSLRHVQESRASYWIRRGVAQAPSFVDDAGAMLTVRIGGVEAYAATSDLSQAGLQAALEHAEQMARTLAGHNLLDLGSLPYPHRAQRRCDARLRTAVGGRCPLVRAVDGRVGIDSPGCASGR